MNKRLFRILMLAFIVAAGCTYLVYRITSRDAAATPKPVTASILVAARNLEIGSIIHDEDLKEGEWVGTPPKGALVAKADTVNRGVISTLYEGEPILDSRLAPAGSGGGLAATIRKGMRACAVKVDDVVGVAGFVLPGMRVDVLVSGTAPGANEGPQTKTVLQNIEVLSAGGNIQKDTDGKPVQVQVVNLLVTPEQAEILSLASNQTRIQLVLRNPLDNDTSKTSGVAMTNLFSEGTPKPKPVRQAPKPAAPAAAPPPHIFLVEIMNGSKRSEEKFSTAEKASSTTPQQ